MSNSVIEEMIAKTFEELKTPLAPKAESRVWKSSNGYIFLVAWSNASLLRILIRRFTQTLPPREFRLKAQLDDAIRSVVANIEEGFARPTTGEYLEYLGFSQASLKEVKGDIQRCRQDGFIPTLVGSSLSGLGIDLKVWHEKKKDSVISKPPGVRGNYRNLEEFKGKNEWMKNPLKSFKFLYIPVDNLKGNDLTYEIFIELINKTDWHLQHLVVSLEEKLSQDQKYYQVQKLRLGKKSRG